MLLGHLGYNKQNVMLTGASDVCEERKKQKSARIIIGRNKKSARIIIGRNKRVPVLNGR